MFAAGFGAMALASVGCGGGTETNTGGSGGGTASSSSSSSSSVATSSSSSGTGGSGGSADGCGTTFETATELTPNDGQGAQCQLPDPLVSSRFFKFTGKKGDVLFVQTDAKPTSDETDPTYPDLVVTLFDDSKTQIARDDDPVQLTVLPHVNDSELWTVLPKDGTFFIQVQECNAVFGEASCSDATQITNYDFAIGIGTIAKDPTENPNFTFEVEPNNDAANANPGLYAKGTNGNYYISQVYGGFSSTSDVDVYKLDLPSDLVAPMNGDYAVLGFAPLPAGADGNGSTATIGKMSLVDAADLANDYAVLDLANAGDTAGVALEPSVPPTQLGKSYYLIVERPSGATAGANDFYIVWHYAFTSNPRETDDTGNDTAAGAEALTDVMPDTLVAQYFVEGDLTSATDVDHYSFNVPAAAKKVSVFCGGQRSGSGVRDLKVDVLNGATSVGSITETVDKDAYLQSLTIPTGVTSLTLKISGGTPDAKVTSRFYRCGVALADM
ncbi:Hypothetical protein A7982_01468 [Minicystis rosea]|nr:Hypothetical protein A7982_01468 [Minicystis rosea]